jgi:hypothetical protein
MSRGTPLHDPAHDAVCELPASQAPIATPDPAELRADTRTCPHRLPHILSSSSISSTAWEPASQAPAVQHAARVCALRPVPILLGPKLREQLHRRAVGALVALLPEDDRRQPRRPLTARRRQVEARRDAQPPLVRAPPARELWPVSNVLCFAVIAVNDLPAHMCSPLATSHDALPGAQMHAEHAVTDRKVCEAHLCSAKQRCARPRGPASTSS